MKSKLLVTIPMTALLAATTAHAASPVKDEIIARCKSTMSQYGAAMVKACVDQDIEAYNALSDYPSEYQEIISRCNGSMREYGFAMVKACADQDIEAAKALENY
ncbi:hypothetical protein Q4485_02920 [Granulosicoccaceae sp. 1_MG-2023]|nr:hypothetical protein [Granulosicoccaceae sp. 1_MG-2023]